MTLTIGRPHVRFDAELAVAALTNIAERQARPTSRSVLEVQYDADERHLAESILTPDTGADLVHAPT
jgi:hypothetical protein